MVTLTLVSFMNTVGNSGKVLTLYDTLFSLVDSTVTTTPWYQMAHTILLHSAQEQLSGLGTYKRTFMIF